MSHFARALEQAMRDRNQRETGARAPATKPPVPPPAPVRAAAPPPVAPAPPVATPEVELPARPVVKTAPEPVKTITDPIYRVDDHLVSLLAAASFAAEQYRALRHVVEQARRATGLSVLAISSPHIGDGKTTTAINLAGALSQAQDARVLLVDLDLRRPSVGAQLGLGGPDLPGVVDAILDSTLTLAEVARPVTPFNFSVLPAGRSTGGFYELLKSPRLVALIEEARQAYDYVVIDTPPLLPMPDCQMIGKCVDGFLLVLACDKTPRRLLADALNVLASDKVLGLVFNHGDELLTSYGDSYASYEHQDRRRRRWSRAAKRVTGSLRHTRKLVRWR